jgi:hypothetical protein
MQASNVIHLNDFKHLPVTQRHTIKSIFFCSLLHICTAIRFIIDSIICHKIYVGPLYQLAANVYVANSSIRFIVEPWYL